MSEKRVYQNKMQNSNKEVVVCNWERGDGKTYSIFQKIIEEKNGRFIYISPFEECTLRDYFNEYIHTNNEKDLIKLFKNSRDRLYLEFNNGNVIEVFLMKPSSNFRGSRNIKIAFCDEYYPSKEFIDSILKPMDVKQVYIMVTNDNMEYIDSRNDIEKDFMKKFTKIASNKESMNNFIDGTIVKLIYEFSLVPQTEKTTMTRNSILDMIGKLQVLRK
jgi:hypothetical protein